MKAARLVCKGCSAVYPLEALFACDRCFGPLEVGYDELDRPVTRADVTAGPAHAVAVRRLPARRAAGRWAAGRLLAADPRRQARRGARPRVRALRQDRDVEPDPLVQGPRRRRGCGQGRRAGLRGARLRLDGQSGRRDRRCRCGARPSRLHLRARRSGAREDRRRRRVRRDGVRRRRLLRRREPAVLRARLRAPVGVRQRQHARLLLGGVEDDRPRDGRASGLARSRPGGRADRVGLALHEDPAGFSRVEPPV